MSIFNNFDFYLLLRLVLSCVCGFVIGSERENKNKSAGTRTHTLVCLGACLGMIVSKYGFHDIVKYDAARVAAQIVSGIGFLGAGVIFIRKDSITGLTTAAGIWTTSIVGMAIGSGMYFIGLISAILIIMFQSFLYTGEIFQKHEQLTIVIESENSSIIDKIDDYIMQNNLVKRSYSLKFNDHKYILNFKVFPKDTDERNKLIRFLESNLKVDKFDIS